MVVGDPMTLNTLVALFRRASNMSFPASVLLTPWRNPASQLSLIAQVRVHALVYARRESGREGGSLVSLSVNATWPC